MYIYQYALHRVLVISSLYITFMYIYIYIHIYTYMYVYIYIHINIMEETRSRALCVLCSFVAWAVGGLPQRPVVILKEPCSLSNVANSF